MGRTHGFPAGRAARQACAGGRRAFEEASAFRDGKAEARHMGTGTGRLGAKMTPWFQVGVGGGCGNQEVEEAVC